MNNLLENALEQLKRCANGQREAILPSEAQALLDERDALREALEDLASYIGVELETLDFEEEREYEATCQKACAAIAKARNEEA